MRTRPNATSSSVASQSTSVEPPAVRRSTAVDQDLRLLRAAYDESGHTLDSVAAHMRIDRSYINKVLHGEKPLRLEFETALPPDLIGLYRKKQAEAYGYIVVRPLTGADAQCAFVAGALGLLASGLPTRASSMAKADLPVTAQAVNQ